MHTEDDCNNTGRRERLIIAELDGQFPDYYALLAVPQDASKKEILFAYRQKARDGHPDKQGSTAKANEAFSHINNAKHALTSRDLRRQYDSQLRTAEEVAGSERRPPPRQSPSSPKSENYTDFLYGQWRRYKGRPYCVPDPLRPPSSAPASFDGAALGDSNTAREYSVPDHPPFGKFTWPLIDHEEAGLWANVRSDDPIYNHLAFVTSICARLCDTAARLEQGMVALDAYCDSNVPFSAASLPKKYSRRLHGDKETCERVHAANSLMWEICRYITAGYQRWQFELTELKTYMAYYEATKCLKDSEAELEAVTVVMDAMLTAIQE